MWELIDDPQDYGLTDYAISQRLKIPQGWIARTIAMNSRNGVHTSMLIVADSNHDWLLPKKK